AGDRADDGAVAGVDLFQRIGDLADRGAHARRLHREIEQVAAAVLGRLGELGQGRPHLRVAAAGANLLQAPYLLLAHAGVVDVENLDRVVGLAAVLVHADDDLLAAVDARLAPRRRFLDAQLR